MKILALSDTHTYFPRFSKIPKGIDLIVMAGDITSAGQIEQYTYFIKKWKEIMLKKNIPQMLFVYGNHDRNPQIAQMLFDDEPMFHATSSGVFEYGGIRFLCSSATKTFGGWAFERSPSGMSEHFFDLFHRNEDIDIVVTHTPPYGIMDYARMGTKEHCGCPYLLEEIINHKPKIHIFGHIHSEYGNFKVYDTHFYNVSQCNDSYVMVNPPVVIEYIKEE